MSNISIPSRLAIDDEVRKLTKSGALFTAGEVIDTLRARDLTTERYQPLRDYIQNQYTNYAFGSNYTRTSYPVEIAPGEYESVYVFHPLRSNPATYVSHKLRKPAASPQLTTISTIPNSNTVTGPSNVAIGFGVLPSSPANGTSTLSSNPFSSIFGSCSPFRAPGSSCCGGTLSTPSSPNANTATGSTTATVTTAPASPSPTTPPPIPVTNRPIDTAIKMISGSASLPPEFRNIIKSVISKAIAKTGTAGTANLDPRAYSVTIGADGPIVTEFDASDILKGALSESEAPVSSEASETKDCNDACPLTCTDGSQAEKHEKAERPPEADRNAWAGDISVGISITGEFILAPFMFLPDGVDFQTFVIRREFERLVLIPWDHPSVAGNTVADRVVISNNSGYELTDSDEEVLGLTAANLDSLDTDIREDGVVIVSILDIG